MSATNRGAIRRESDYYRTPEFVWSKYREPKIQVI